MFKNVRNVVLQILMPELQRDADGMATKRAFNEG